MTIVRYLCVALIVSVFVVTSLDLQAQSYETKHGYRTAKVDAKYNNPWPADLEKEFGKHAKHAVDIWMTKRIKGNSYGEQEKKGYPMAMYALIGGKKADGLKILEAASVGPPGTSVDLYWCFTLKGQVRKYFLFGDMLNPAYKKQMFNAFKGWSSKDPLNIKKSLYTDPKWGTNWNPSFVGSKVDVRNTDNLRAMRNTSVYLFAEAAGNKKTAAIYKKRIELYAQQLYNVGMTEWDSANYFSHTLVPYHNLYDFAKDPEVRMYAKAILDWMYCAAALKYYRGGFGGANARCYNMLTTTWECPVTHALGLYFGDSPIPDPKPDYDDVHHITSAYRPPLAAVKLARKKIKLPTEVHITHIEYNKGGYRPPFEDWQPGDKTLPLYWDTLYQGKTFSLGSAVSKEIDRVEGNKAPKDHWNILTFRLITKNSKRGIDAFTASTHGFGPAYKVPGEQVVQHRNLCVFMAKGDAKYSYMIPKTAEVSTEGGITFLKFEKTWIAMRPINMDLKSVDPEATEKLNFRTKKKKDKVIKNPWKVDEKAMTAQGKGGVFSGFALEIGEDMSFEDFKKSVKAKSKFTVSGETVMLQGMDGKSLKVIYNKQHDRPQLWRDGVEFDYDKNIDLYKTVLGDPVITQGWHSGKICVEAGGSVFEGKLSKDGKYSFTNK